MIIDLVDLQMAERLRAELNHVPSFRKYLRQCHNSVREKMDTSVSPELQWLQGSSQTLADLIELFDEDT